MGPGVLLKGLRPDSKGLRPDSLAHKQWLEAPVTRKHQGHIGRNQIVWLQGNARAGGLGLVVGAIVPLLNSHPIQPAV